MRENQNEGTGKFQVMLNLPQKLRGHVSPEERPQEDIQDGKRTLEATGDKKLEASFRLFSIQLHSDGDLLNTTDK